MTNLKKRVILKGYNMKPSKEKEIKKLLERIITCDYHGKKDKIEILKKLLKRKYRKLL